MDYKTRTTTTTSALLKNTLELLISKDYKTRAVRTRTRTMLNNTLLLIKGLQNKGYKNH